MRTDTWRCSPSACRTRTTRPRSPLLLSAGQRTIEGRKETSMARRGANGRSTIVKQADGRWHGFVSMGAKGDGTRDRRHVSAATRAGAVEKVKALEARRDAGMAGGGGRAMPVDEWLPDWRDNR